MNKEIEVNGHRYSDFERISEDRKVDPFVLALLIRHQAEQAIKDYEHQLFIDRMNA
ncbi:MAG: hypothetical protein Q8P89_03685 [bacterium]|nr:hypothetical protein [bacterium]